jgi:hypothetical protein
MIKNFYTVCPWKNSQKVGEIAFPRNTIDWHFEKDFSNQRKVHSNEVTASLRTSPLTNGEKAGYEWL